MSIAFGQDEARELLAHRRDRRSVWWWGVVAIPPLVAVLTTVLAPDPHGHWTEHLASASLKSTQLVLLVVLAAMLGRRRWSPLLMAAGTAIAAGVVLQALGDFEVADSIWRTTGDPGFGAGYDEGHDRSALGDLIVLGGGLAFVVVAAVARRVSIPLAVAAAVLMVIPPPFFWPAVGVMVLMLHWLTIAPRPVGRDAGSM
jgi:drug/metabolite transporter (DMT)-like permease